MEKLSPLDRLHADYDNGRITPLIVADRAIAAANGNASRNTYLWLDPDSVRRQAEALGAARRAGLPLWGVPVSLKDCFDLRGAPTTCGSRFYAARPVAISDSAVAARLGALGAIITGKTHLHPLAYGITGQNPDYGDCLQPRDATVLTGGSSSGAAASVQEGSALVAIGTDTGGSIRVPAALCGLVAYRASHSLGAGAWPGACNAWDGAAHLAPSFDTLGFLLRDPRDAGPVGRALFGLAVGSGVPGQFRIGTVSQGFLADCDAETMTAFASWKRELAGAGIAVEQFDAEAWHDSLEIFAGIQAHEAAGLHAGAFDAFDPAIRDRLRWGASLTPETLTALRQRLEAFRTGMQSLFDRYDLLMLPTAPVRRLPAHADLSQARSQILRYTTPFSLCGSPALSLPGELLGAPLGTGVQVAARAGEDASLLAFADWVGRMLAAKGE